MKKNYKSIPTFIDAKIQSIESTNIVVAVAKDITLEQLSNGSFAHLGMVVENNLPNFELEVIPPSSVGKYSDRNVNGYSIKRMDLPKVYKTIYLGERPNYGDYNRGTFDLYVGRHVYQTEEFLPRETSIKIELLGQKADTYTFKFTVNDVLDKLAPDFRINLLINLNLLQENLGKVDVFSSTANNEDFIKTTFVGWELLPPSQRDENLERILTGIRKISESDKLTIIDRYDFLVKLKPERFIVGISGMRRYFGAKFTDNLVVFENVLYGNAIYVLFENWDYLSKLTRKELSARPANEVEKIIHSEGWKGTLKRVIRRKFNK